MQPVLVSLTLDEAKQLRQLLRVQCAGSPSAHALHEKIGCAMKAASEAAVYLEEIYHDAIAAEAASKG